MGIQYGHTMKLQRKRTRGDYHQWQVSLPGGAVTALGWDEGDELVVTAEDGALVVRKAGAAARPAPKPVPKPKPAPPMPKPEVVFQPAAQVPPVRRMETSAPETVLLVAKPKRKFRDYEEFAVNYEPTDAEMKLDKDTAEEMLARKWREYERGEA